MNTNLLIIFIVLNALNVIIQTVKSLATVNCGKLAAAVTNAIAYGLYTVVVVYMVCDLPLWLKALIIGGCNLIGVYVVKFFEEKFRKEKIWKVEITVKNKDIKNFLTVLQSLKIPYSIIGISGIEYEQINVYCYSQKDSLSVKKLTEKFDVKYFVSESKVL